MLNVGGHKLGFLGLHLKAIPDDEYSNAQRGGQAEIARQIVRAQIVPQGYLPIVLGRHQRLRPGRARPRRQSGHGDRGDQGSQGF